MTWIGRIMQNPAPQCIRCGAPVAPIIMDGFALCEFCYRRGSTGGLG